MYRRKEYIKGKSKSNKGKQGYIKSIQAIRALAFINIFVAHMGYEELFPSGAGVTTFFVLSGFCMALKYFPDESVAKISLKGNMIFALNHIRKIFLLHIVIWLFWIVRSLVFHTKILHIGTLLNVVLLQSLFANKDIYFSCNAVTWYLSTYLFICLLIPCILLILKKVSRKQVSMLMVSCLLMIIIIGICANQFSDACSGDTLRYICGICPLSRLFDVVLGMGGVFVHSNLSKIKKNYVTVLEILCIVLWGISVYIYIEYDKVPDAYKSVLLFILPAVLTVYVFAMEKGFISRCMRNRILVFLGNISPYTYMIHLFLLDSYKMIYERFILPIIGVPMNNVVRGVLCFFATILISKVYDANIRKRS